MTGKATPAEVYQGLRRQALQVTAEALGLEVESDEPYGLLMETGYPAAVVTLVAMGEGSASLYFSTGGGILMGGRYEQVQAAALDLIAVAGHYLELMTPTESFPHPVVGQTRFYVLTSQGVYAAEAAESDLIYRTNALSPLFGSAQALITELRRISEKQGA